MSDDQQHFELQNVSFKNESQNLFYNIYLKEYSSVVKG